MDEILENQNLVYHIIHKYYGNYPNKDDLFQVGIMGMVEAKKNYDQSFNTKFTTFAYKFILGEINKYVLGDKSIKISKDTLKLYYKINKTKLLLYQKYGREPSIQELASFLEIKEEILLETLNIPINTQSLDEPIQTNGKEVSLYDYIEGSTNSQELFELREEINKLPREEQRLIYDRYIYDLSQTEVAKKLGKSQVQVSRYEKKVLSKLKDRLRT